MKIKNAKWIIGGLWIGGFLITFIILTMQTFAGLYEDKTKEVYDWFTPLIVPTLGLIIAAFGYDFARPDPNDDKPIGWGVFGLTFGLSVVYLLTLISVFFFAVYAEKRIEFYRQASLPLGLIQGLVTAAMAIFFQRRQQ